MNAFRIEFTSAAGDISDLDLGLKQRVEFGTKSYRGAQGFLGFSR